MLPVHGRIVTLEAFGAAKGADKDQRELESDDVGDGSGDERAALVVGQQLLVRVEGSWDHVAWVPDRMSRVQADVEDAGEGGQIHSDTELLLPIVHQVDVAGPCQDLKEGPESDQRLLKVRVLLPDALGDADHNQEDDCHADKREHPEYLLSTSSIFHHFEAVDACDAEVGCAITSDARTFAVDAGEVDIILNHHFGTLVETLGLEEISESGGLIALCARFGVVWRTGCTRILTEEVHCNVRLDSVHVKAIEGLCLDTKGARNDVLDWVAQVFQQNDHFTWVRFRELHNIVESQRLCLPVSHAIKHIDVSALEPGTERIIVTKIDLGRQRQLYLHVLLKVLDLNCQRIVCFKV